MRVQLQTISVYIPTVYSAYHWYSVPSVITLHYITLQCRHAIFHNSWARGYVVSLIVSQPLLGATAPVAAEKSDGAELGRAA
jgi:hypothetical protein